MARAFAEDGLMYRQFFRRLLFRLEPERAHNLTLQALRLVGTFPFITNFLGCMFVAHRREDLSVNVFGLNFSNPLGLAAGYDKDGLAWRGLAALGFGHIEIGTVTPQPQSGNPKPRVFRIPAERAVINRMGFPGRGAAFVTNQLNKDTPRNPGLILGVNIGKNKDTPNETAVQDYTFLLKTFSPLVDYLAVNVSSPNTVGLRRLQARDDLEKLLRTLQEERSLLQNQRPILVKLAPDLTDEELDDAIGVIMDARMDGVIATNTTISRHNLRSAIGAETGGLSGAPLAATSREVVTKIQRRTHGNLPIIGVGGIMSPQDAKAMLAAGATLIQIYTGMIYVGPFFVREILESL